MMNVLRMSGCLVAFVFALVLLNPMQVLAADIVSGTLYLDQGVTADTSIKEITVLVNGLSPSSGMTDVNGAYSIDTGITIVPGDVVTAFVSGATNAHGASIILADGPPSDLDIYYDYLITRHATGSHIARSDLETGNNGDPDLVFVFDDDSVVFSVNNMISLLVPVGNTFFMDSPTDSSGSFDIEGVLDLGAQDLNLEGDLVIEGSLNYDANSNQEIVFDGGGVRNLDYAGALPRFVINEGGTLHLLSAIDANNGISVSGGSTLDADVYAIDLEGSIDVASGSTLVAPSSTFWVAGNINIDGIFFHNDGAIILDSGSDQDVFGGNVGGNLYHDLTIADIGARRIGFEEDQVHFVAGIFSADLGTNGAQLRTIDAGGAVLGDDSQHTLNIFGSVGTINALDIQDSVLQFNGNVISPAFNGATTINRGNTRGWFDVTVVGTVDGVESGLDAEFEVVASVPNNTGSDVVVTYSFTGGTANPGSVNDYDDTTTSVVIPDGQSVGKITVPISQDTNDGEGPETIEITLVSAGDDYDVVTVPASRTITSTLIPRYDISESSFVLPEGEEETFVISLNRAPYGDVQFSITSQDTTDVTVSPASVTFTPSNWNVPQTVTVRSVDEQIDRDGDTTDVDVNISATPVDSGFDNLAEQFLTVVSIDNDESVVGSGPGNTIEIYRFWSALFRGHFYTISVAERDSLIANDPNWVYEGIFANAANASEADTSPVYRFWSENYKHHFFTISIAERDSLIANDPNWLYEGEAYYAYASEEDATQVVYRFYSPVYLGHFYTTSEAERDSLIANDPNWVYEGLAWYVPR